MGEVVPVGSLLRPTPIGNKSGDAADCQCDCSFRTSASFRSTASITGMIITNDSGGAAACAGP